MRVFLVNFVIIRTSGQLLKSGASFFRVTKCNFCNYCNNSCYFSFTPGLKETFVSSCFLSSDLKNRGRAKEAASIIALEGFAKENGLFPTCRTPVEKKKSSKERRQLLENTDN